MSQALVVEPAALKALESALLDERTALLENNVEALLLASSAKLTALRLLEIDPPPQVLADRLARLSELNRNNGILLARRRRVVDWTLRQLGRQAPESLYDTHGKVKSPTMARALGIG